VGTLAGHGVVRLVDGELERVVAAEAFPAVGNITTDAGHNAGLARLKVSDGVEVTLAWAADSCRPEVDLDKPEQSPSSHAIMQLTKGKPMAIATAPS
jgi:hypothetical protein